MRTLRTIIILLILWLATKPAVGQRVPVVEDDHPIYQLEERLMIGERKALYEIAPYFDSDKKVIEYLGYHELATIESAVAKRVVAENTLFTNEEFIITDSSTAKQFTDFLNENKYKIVFSKLATSFLITPLEKRTVVFEIRAISETRKQELQDVQNDDKYHHPLPMRELTLRINHQLNPSSCQLTLPFSDF